MRLFFFFCLETFLLFSLFIFFFRLCQFLSLFIHFFLFLAPFPHAFFLKAKKNKTKQTNSPMGNFPARSLVNVKERTRVAFIFFQRECSFFRLLKIGYVFIDKNVFNDLFSFFLFQVREHCEYRPRGSSPFRNFFFVLNGGHFVCFFFASQQFSLPLQFFVCVCVCVCVWHYPVGNLAVLAHWNPLRVHKSRYQPSNNVKTQ